MGDACEEVSLLAIVGMFTVIAIAQDRGGWISSLPQARDYIQKRRSSYDRSGGNDDARPIASGETLVLLDAPRPGLVSHIWVTNRKYRSESFEGAGAARVLGRRGHAKCRGADR